MGVIVTVLTVVVLIHAALNVRSLRLLREAHKQIDELRKNNHVIRDLVMAASENYNLRMDEFNKRLVDVETDKQITVKPRSDEDDPFSGASSWSAQMAAAERGTGVRA